MTEWEKKRQNTAESDRKREIEEKLGRLQMDMDDINNRKFLLDSVRESLANT